VPNDWCDDEVADHAMALLLAVARKITVYDRATRGGTWQWQSGAPIHRLGGSVLGLLSFGAIARAIAARARGFGLRTVAHDPFVPDETIRAAGAEPVSFDELVTESDCLVIQAPLTPETHHLFDEPQLRRMKPTAILVNTARGPIIDDRALYRALSEGWIAGAGLDDIEEEPAKVRDWRPDNPLFGLDNVIITPHSAYYSEEAISTVRNFAAEEVVRVLTGHPPLSPVNAGELLEPRWSRSLHWLERGDADANAAAKVVASSHYRRIDLGDPDSVSACIAGVRPVAVYLALPPAVFPVAVSALHAAGLPAGSEVVLEKPFGEDLDSAKALNRLLAEKMDERHVFRVDHFLAMTTVQNILGTRLANRVLEPIWNAGHIEEIEIVWDESLALEGRAGYYDGVGALKDMVQNHLLQLLCLVAMEPPTSLGERDLRDRKVDVLRSVRPLDDDAVAVRTRRARYGAGQVHGRHIPAYVGEEGVDAEHGTETFAEVALHLDSWRWSGTTFRLRTGKALGHDRKEIVVRFRPVPHHPFDRSQRPAPNILRFGLEPEGLGLELTGSGPDPASSLVPLVLEAEMEPPELPAYGRILLDVLRGDATMSIRADEAEEAWRIVTPVLEGWARNLAPLDEYAAGSLGPG
jgi:glucose-6-phosphate 1-dehydrogenase